MKSRYSLFWLLVFGAFLYRTVVLWYGFDRIPLLTGSDDVFWTDPALSLAEGDGYRARNYEGGVFRLDAYFSNHPPVYVWVLAAAFKLLGVTPLAIRGADLVAHLLTIALLLFLFLRLHRLQILDRFSFGVVVTLCLTNFSTLTMARWGRPEPVEMLFVVAAFTVIATEDRRALGLRYSLAGLLLGLAVATHTLAAFYYVALLVLLGYQLLQKRLSLPAAAAGVLLPPLVFGLIWVATFGGQSIEALQQHLAIGKWARKDFGGFEVLTALARGKLRNFLLAGGTTVVVIALSWGLVAGRWLWLTAARRFDQLWQWLTVLGLILILQIVFIARISDLTVTRAYLYFPLALVAIALALTRGAFFGYAADISPESGWRREGRDFAPSAAVVVVVLLTVGEIVQAAGYLFKIHREWAARDPQRLDGFVEKLRPYRYVAVPSTFWYACVRQGIPFRVIDFGFEPTRDYVLAHPEMLHRFDAVVVPNGHLLLTTGALTGPAVGSFTDLDQSTYTIIEPSK